MKKVQRMPYISSYSQSLKRFGATFGIQGGAGSFNEEALLYYLQSADIKQYEIVSLYTTERVLQRLSSGQIDYGLFAIHNSLGGRVHESFEAIRTYRFQVLAEVEIPIRHYLLKKPNVPFWQIDTIMTHPQVLKQCRATLQKKYADVRLSSGQKDFRNTARVAQAVADGELPHTTAVIGSARLSKLYGLQIVDGNLQDAQTNRTRFLLTAMHN